MIDKKQYMKNYYNTHKEDLRRQRSENIYCSICDKNIQAGYFDKHKTTNKHIRRETDQNKDQTKMLTDRIQQLDEIIKRFNNLQT